jgi:type IV secretory pathway protease TraF
VDYFHYDGPVPSGKVFVMAPHPRSFDSRYWGFVDESWGLYKCWPLPLSDR